MKLCKGKLRILDTHHEHTASYRMHRLQNDLNMRNADWWSGGLVKPVGVKRVKLVCPICKRRVTASVRTCEDGCCLYQELPPHKPKRWWKKRRH